MSKVYYRPLVQCDVARPADAYRLAGGWGWFSHVEVLSRSGPSRIVAAGAIPAETLENLVAPRADLCGLSLHRPRVMGIVNTTPDSFSDGGDHASLADAQRGALDAIAGGADLLDIGGESTRPGAQEVDAVEEIRRTQPVITALRKAGVTRPISIDTRKAPVARAALGAGASLINDVSGFTFDPDLSAVAAHASVPVCVMHAQGDPETMQQDPHYDDVLLDVFDFLERRVAALREAGIARSRILVDPGIGFGKTLDHNLTLLSRISLFHSLGTAVLLGASRKRFIGTIGGAASPKARGPGSVAVALAALAQGVQVVRVHDVAETAQAIALWRACMAGCVND